MSRRNKALLSSHYAYRMLGRWFYHYCAESLNSSVSSWAAPSRHYELSPSLSSILTIPSPFRISSRTDELKWGWESVMSLVIWLMASSFWLSLVVLFGCILRSIADYHSSPRRSVLGTRWPQKFCEVLVSNVAFLTSVFFGSRCCCVLIFRLPLFLTMARCSLFNVVRVLHRFSSTMWSGERGQMSGTVILYPPSARIPGNLLSVSFLNLLYRSSLDYEVHR